MQGEFAGSFFYADMYHRYLYEIFLHEGRHLYISHLTSTDIKKDLRALENALPMPLRKVNIKINAFAALRSCD